MMKPPISRMGGKSKLRSKIIELFPEHKCYVEVFFGAGWVYFGKDKSKCEVINDKDKELINLFKIIKHHNEEFERLLQYEISSRDIFLDYRTDSYDKLTDIQRAVRFMYIISQSFASKGDTYGYATSKGPSNKIFNTSNLKEVRARLSNTFVENLDFEDLIKRYDREHTLFFCDPPYLETAGYHCDFKKDDHYRLYEVLSGAKGKFILTINDHPHIRELYHSYDIEVVETMYSVSKNSNKKVNELIIKNF